MNLKLKQSIDEHDRTVAEEALNQLVSMSLPAQARWRVMQLEAMLCEKTDQKELAEP